MTHDIEAERKLFEAHCLRHSMIVTGGYWGSSYIYNDRNVQLVWVGWQAKAAAVSGWPGYVA